MIGQYNLTFEDEDESLGGKNKKKTKAIIEEWVPFLALLSCKCKPESLYAIYYCQSQSKGSAWVW